MNMNLRTEEEKDYKTVEFITREAFWNLYKPGADEHFIVNHIRTHQDFISELALVLEVDSEIVGSIFYTQAEIIDHNAIRHSVIALGPVSILPKYQKQGLGRRLINHSIHKAIFLAGSPDYYQYYGFNSAKKYNISAPDGVFYKCIMTLPLYKNALKDIHGAIHFSKAMYPDPSKLKVFDSNFPIKEKKITDSQLEFQKTAVQQDEKTINLFIFKLKFISLLY